MYVPQPVNVIVSVVVSEGRVATTVMTPESKSGTVVQVSFRCSAGFVVTAKFQVLEPYVQVELPVMFRSPLGSGVSSWMVPPYAR